MALLRRLRTETAVKNGVRRRRGAWLALRALGKPWCVVQYGGLDDDADEERDKCRNLRRGVVGVLRVGLAMAHAKRLLAVVLRGILLGHVGAGHCRFHRRMFIRRVHPHRAGIGCGRQLHRQEQDQKESGNP